MLEFFTNSAFFKLDALNGFICLGILFFGALTLIYSIRFMRGKPNLFGYYFCIILTILASLVVALANNLIVLLVAWGFLGFTLYLLITQAGPGAVDAAKKTLIIVGGSDGLMVLGIGIIWSLTNTFKMDEISLLLSNWSIITVAYLCLAIAAFAKAGVIPFHSWIPDCAEHAPLPVTAFLPASLDKLLGIYLLARISLNLFVMNEAMRLFLMIIGAITILAAVMMALVQHNLKRLLGYHAVSQVGYMVLGIGTGVPVGIAGGLFHMINNAIYKSCLFLTGGSVEYKQGTAELSKLGGLAKVMPITFICCLVASLSISGVPLFNGFISKWMIYQGVLASLSASKYQILIILCLVAAMFGSALTLASFMKLLHAIFLGQGKKAERDEVSIFMWLPQVALAVLCVVFGIFAHEIPLRFFIYPAVEKVMLFGIWFPSSATILILAGIIIGVFVYMIGNLKKIMRRDVAYVGAEPTLPVFENRPTGTEFYNTVKELGFFGSIYKKAEKGVFDIYIQGKKFVFATAEVLRYLHNGILPTYLTWCLLGMIILYFILH
jgi:formate hydrogenlyase subunit 3/multisubunit Na+/H+ antiporter MnhD subunit